MKTDKVSAEERAATNSEIGKKTFSGIVVSDRMKKTIVVRVDRKVRHSRYFKYVKQSQRVKAHDEKNQAKIGDLVEIVESRPLSRDKRWALKKILRVSGLSAVVDSKGEVL